MATAYTSLLGLALPVTGELSGTWGNTVNTEITSLLDSAIAGTTTISADADITLTTTTGAANESREAIILWTAGGTTTRNITAPAQSKAYIVINKSSSTQSIVLRGAGPTTGVTIIKGEAAVCAWNGTDFIKVSNTSGSGTFSNLTVTGTTTLSGLTASTALALDASKNVVSVTNTGTGNNVLSASPTLTGTIAGASLSLSSLTSGRVPFATTAGLLTDSANLLYSGTDLTVYGLTVGRGAGAQGTNTAVGASALAANSTGGNNTAIGYQAGQANNGDNITFIGRQAGTANTSGSANTALGSIALFTNTTGSNNTAIGEEALRLNTTASNNTAVGYQSLYTNTTGTNLAALGKQALYNNSTGNNNTAVGYEAALTNNASDLTVVGSQALKSNSTGGANTAVGAQALTLNTTGGNNNAFGYAALTVNTTGANNVAVGTYALQANTTASNNTAVGYQASYSNVTGPESTAVGYQAGYNSTGGYNTFLGKSAGYGQTTGDSNTYLGRNIASAATVTGNSNTIVGNRAFLNATSGSNNTAMGNEALALNAASSNSTAIGYQAGLVATGAGNQLFGYFAGSAITTGAKNVILGSYTGSAAPISATGSNYIVLSDGDGNVRSYWNSSGNAWVVGGSVGGTVGQSNSAGVLNVAINGTITADSVLAVFGTQVSVGNSVVICQTDSTGQSNAAAAIRTLKANSTGRSINCAGTVNASGADYAEYMTKCGDFTFAKGDVCGVNADGKLTNVFADAISFVVKSTDPSYVGGDNWHQGIDPRNSPEDKAALEALRTMVDRIAFAGQVPINVTGATAGQYIVPVNNNGAIKGEAVSNPTFEQYQSSVGKVIAIEADGRARIIVKVS